MLDPKKLRVGILGYTSSIGSTLAERIVEDSIFKSVVLIGPRFITYKDSSLMNEVKNFDSTEFSIKFFFLRLKF